MKLNRLVSDILHRLACSRRTWKGGRLDTGSRRRHFTAPGRRHCSWYCAVRSILNGLALSLRERFPAMVKDFHHYCQQSHPKPGAAWVRGGADTDGCSARIISLLIQDPSEGRVQCPARPA